MVLSCLLSIPVCGLTGGELPGPEAFADLNKAKQHGEDKPAQPLSDLSVRLNRILEMQTRISEGVNALHKAIQGTSDQKPRSKHQQAALTLAAHEQDIIGELTKAITILEKGGAAVALTEVARKLRVDAKHVQGYLNKCDTGTAARAIEKDILATLKEMIGSLKRR
jgi:hypothetical protein